MRPERRNFLIGALAVVALSALGSRGVRRSSCTGGSCCVPLPGLCALGTDYWPGAVATNQAVTPEAEGVGTNMEH